MWASMNEAQLQNGAEHTLRGLGSVWYCHIPASAYSGMTTCPFCRKRYKQPTTIPAGIPDTFAVYPNLLVVAELKTMKGKLSPVQERIWAALGDNPQIISSILRPDNFNNWADRVAQSVIKGVKH